MTLSGHCKLLMFLALLLEALMAKDLLQAVGVQMKKMKKKKNETLKTKNKTS